MKTIYFLRHAKSCWSDVTLQDFDRPLNKRGNKAAVKMGHYLKHKALMLDLIVTSPALRTRQTCQHIVFQLAKDVTIVEDRSLYSGDASDYIKCIQGLADAYQTVLIIGHNFSIEQAAKLLTNEHITMKTATLVKMQSEHMHWQDINKAKLIDVQYVRELK